MQNTSQDRLERWFRIIPYLARMELARRYAGSLLGSAWAIAYPAVQIGVYWVVFALGLKINAGNGVSFGALLIAGMAPWFAITECLTSMTGSISNNAQLVKRVIFPLEVLPIASLLAALDLRGSFCTKRFVRNWLGKELGHAEEETDAGADCDAAAAD